MSDLENRNLTRASGASRPRTATPDASARTKKVRMADGTIKTVPIRPAGERPSRPATPGTRPVSRQAADAPVRTKKVKMADGTIKTVPVRPNSDERAGKRMAAESERRVSRAFAEDGSKARNTSDAARPRRSASPEERVRRSAADTENRIRRASKEGEARARRAADASASRKAAEVTNRRNPADNPRARRAGQNPNADRRVPGQTRALRTNDNRRPKAAPEKKKPIFWIGLGIYAVVLIIISIFFLGYTSGCLKKYEASQSENYMKNAVKDFKKMVDNGTIADKLNLPDVVGELESPDIIKNMYLKQFEGKSNYTFAKDKKSYDAKSPVYEIMADGTVVAKLKLKATNEKKVFAILELCDWSVESIQPVFVDNNITTKSYSINVPKEYKVTVNGNTLGEKYLTGKSEVNPEFVNVVEYVEMPATVEYKISGLINEPDIKIYDTTGAEVKYTPDAKGNIFVAYAASAATEMPADLKEYALGCVQTWQDFLNHDFGGEANNGLARVQKFLIDGNVYWQQAKDYSHSADITFISAHVNKNPKYSDIITDNYIRYNDKCFSVHFKFTKYMLLTKTNATATDVIDGTYYFVQVSDGNGGTRWAIADMSSTTNN